MKFSTIFLLVTCLILGCSKKDDEQIPPSNPMVGTTWVHFGFRSPVNGKDVYYYLSFTSATKVESYVKYNKIELSSSDTKVYTYTFNNSKVIMLIDGVSYNSEVSGNKLLFNSKGRILEYTKD